jgi:hypothetical protein
MATRPSRKPKHPLELAAKQLRAGGALSAPWVLHRFNRPSGLSGLDQVSDSAARYMLSLIAATLR